MSLIPARLRQDLVINKINENGEDLYILKDNTGFSWQPVILSAEILAIINLFNGVTTCEEISEKIFGITGEKLNSGQINNIANNLSLLGYLETPRYQRYLIELAHYRSSDVRPPACAGFSYPEGKAEFEKFIDSFTLQVQVKKSPPPKAIIAPHIDFKLGAISLDVYSKAYEALEGSNPDLFVIFGTSHYGNSGYFMLTRKHFETPAGVAEIDLELINLLNAKFNGAIIFDDIAHMHEHSIEFQTAIIKRRYPQARILPVLTGPLQHLFGIGTPIKKTEWKLFIDSLVESINELKRNTVYIASADFSHFGRKFEDKFDAEDLMDEANSSDMDLINSLVNCDVESFFNKIASKRDKWRVCGLSPIYALIHATKPSKAKFLKYNTWKEKETKSAVSFAAMAFY